MEALKKDAWYAKYMAKLNKAELAYCEAFIKANDHMPMGAFEMAGVRLGMNTGSFMCEGTKYTPVAPAMDGVRPKQTALLSEIVLAANHRSFHSGNNK